MNWFLCLLDIFQNGRTGVHALARQAIRFIRSCLKNHHPRVRGQTLNEVQSHYSV